MMRYSIFLLTTFFIFGFTSPETNETPEASYQSLLTDLKNNLEILTETSDADQSEVVINHIQSLTIPAFNRIEVSYIFDEDEESVRYRSVTLSNDWLIRDLNFLNERHYDAASVAIVLERITRALEFIETLSHRTLVRDSVDYRSRAEQILSRKEYRDQAGKNLLAEALDWLLQKIIDALKELFKNFKWPEPATRTPVDFKSIGQIMLYIVYVAGAVLLILLIRQWVRYRQRRKQETADLQKDFSHILNPGESTEPDEHLMLAERHASEGNYRKAVRHIWLSLILFLDKHDHVRYKKFQTNEEYLQWILEQPSLPQREAIYESMRHVAMVFDRKWYGLSETAESDFESCKHHHVLVMQSLSEPALLENA
ncbi:hypothetical protein HUU42_03660 [bacterium]|nr:hypothetical protein [bacterium]